MNRAVIIANSLEAFSINPDGAHLAKTISNSVVDLGTIHANTQSVLIEVQTQSVRVRWDGTDPDANTGFLLTAGTRITVSRQIAAAMKLIRATGSDGAVFCAQLLI